MFLMKIFNMRKFYFKIFFSFSILSILIVLSTSILISSIYMRNVYTQLEENYSLSLGRLNTEFNDILSTFNTINFTLRQYPEINTFLQSNTSDTQEIVRAHSLLVSLTTISPFIYSTILYNRDYSYPIIFGQSGVDLAQFLKPKLSSPNIKSNLNIVYSNINQYRTIDSKLINTISIIYTGPYASTNPLYSAVIINIDSEAINRNLLSKYDGITLITDNNGKIIFSNYDSSIDNSFYGENYIKRVIKEKSPSGKLKINDGKDTKIVTFTKNTLSGFYIINVNSYKGISGIIKDKILNIVLICLGIMLIYCIVAYFLSKKIYSPIGEATKMFSSLSKNNQEHEPDEIAYITKVFSETVEELNQLEMIRETQSNKFKSEHLKFILKNNTISKDIIDDMKKYKLNVTFYELILVSLKIDNYYEIDRNERYAYEATLCKAIPDLIRDNFNCEVVNLYKGEIAILINFKYNVVNSFDILLSQLEKMISTIHTTMLINITAGIGETANTLEECSSAYNTAVEMVKHRFVVGMNKVIYQQYIDNNLSNSINFSKEAESNLKNSIKLNKKQNYIENIEYIMDLLKKCTYSKSVSILFQVMTICINTINETISQEESSYSMNFEEFNQLFIKLQTIDDAKVWLLNIFNEYERAYEEVLKEKNHRYDNFVMKIQDYIKQNYSDSNMCVDTIAEITGYAPYYFSKIFKDITGLNIRDYIREIRINKAKELLETTDINANDIGSMIGFSNTSNFYLVFKKDVGMAPVAYRQLNMSKTLEKK